MPSSEPPLPEALIAAALRERLALFGALHPDPDPCLPESAGLGPDGGKNSGTLLLFGPAEPGFWDHFTAQPEYSDGAPDPLDRWSKRVLVPLAQAAGGTALFPSDGPPYPPFIAWALASGQAFTSPVGLLVHHTAGLMVSYRGAIYLPTRHALPVTAANPCESCAAQPCRTACPVAALTPAGYDIPACKSFLATPEGTDCMTQGCAVRRACPLSQTYGRLPGQSAFHMKAFR
ncbi:ferredoxin [Rhodalgimonas zhirmunskyi]|uniref:Ferredoxin n=1 Tax=Rhodalgimonas zhirmunskyi TaxID=2964767 RepID=A0AAJ1UDX0_9RHOB|nr:ferredoxin [Rhodoalgimonas zhirmunskyi]MDQ2095733.1 ferredoxin [Rhodoalgimonas zhirmunskyi]